MSKVTTPLVAFYQNIRKETGMAPSTLPVVSAGQVEGELKPICRYGRWVLVEARWVGGNHVIVELPLLAA